MPRFVILRHDHPFLHWDFFLECGDVCRTWRLLDSPDVIESAIPAEPLTDHRLMYLDYEGPVSGDRGTVRRWDVGTFEWRTNRPDECEVVLQGTIWRGLVRLFRKDEKIWICERPGSHD